MIDVRRDKDVVKDKDVVYFTGLMMVNNHLAVQQLLEKEDCEHLHISDFMGHAVEQGLKLSVIMSSKEAIVDNLLNDLMKAGELL